MPRKRHHDTATARAAARVARVLKEGGSRRTFLLSPDATKALAELRQRWQCKSDTETVETALFGWLNLTEAKNG